MNDTTLGGDDRAFPATTIGFAGALGDPDGPGYLQALETLCVRYWKPVYSFLRISWAKSNDDAKDLTQAFFLNLLEDPALRRFDPARGGFRAYLKTLLRRFASREERDRLRLKRGGGVRILPLTGEAPDVADPNADPEREFERVWLEDLVRQAVEAVRAASAPARFRVYEAYTAAEPPPSYAELAARLGIGVGEVEKSLHLTREAIRLEVRARVVESAGDGAEAEWRRILGE
ncbi:MAG TPA: sigma-70 family RNA polymerase sigma factor [Planctomycetota bacterium]